MEKGIMIDQWLESQGNRREGLYYRNIQEIDRQRTIALFAHSGSLSAIISRMLNIPFPMLCGLLQLAVTSITILHFNNQPGSISLPDIEIANDRRHIVGVVPKDEPQSRKEASKKELPIKVAVPFEYA